MTSQQVGAKEHPVYGGGRYLMNIYFLKYCCLDKKRNPNRHGHKHGIRKLRPLQILNVF